MADPLSISAGQGLGEAQVFQKDLTPAMGVQYQLGERRRLEDKEEARKRAKEKATKDIFENIDELNVTGYLPHINYLNKQKDTVRDYITSKYVETKGKYDAVKDPVVGKLVSTFKKENEMSDQIKNWAKTLPTMLTKESAKNYTPESVLEIDNFLKMPLGDQVKYIEEKGKFPVPEPKPEVIDWRKQNEEDFKKLGTVSYSSEVPLEGGITQVKAGKRTPQKNVDDYVKLYVESGLNGQDPKAVALIQETEKELTEKNPTFRYMNDEDKLKLVKAEAERKKKEHGSPFLSVESKTELQGSEQSGGLKIGLGNAEVKDMYYKLESPESRQAGGKSIIIFGKKGGTAIPANTFADKGGEKVSGQPTGVIQDMGGADDTNLEMEVIITGKDRFGAPTKEKKFIPLTKSDVNKKKFEGEYGVDIDKLYNDPNFIGQGKKDVSERPKEKTVSVDKIKALVGKPGYEGYSEQELIEYYKSQGYNIK